MLSDPYAVVTRHDRGVREEKERARDERHVEDVHSRASENLLGEDDCKSRSDGEHPKRSVDGNNHRDDDTRDEEALMNFFVLPLCYSELDTQTDDIADDDLWQHSQEAVEEHTPEGGILQLAGSERVLITYVVHTEEQRRHKRDDNERHDALAVDGIVHMCAAASSCRVGHESERLEAIIKRTEGVELATLFEVRLYIVEKFS